MSLQAAEVRNEVSKLDESRRVIVKARVVGGDRPPTQAEAAVDDVGTQFTIQGAVEPPYILETLMSLLEHSNSLRQNVDSYATNIHSHGHHFEPIIDLASDDANQRIAALMMERRNRRGAEDPAVADPTRQQTKPTDEEVQAARDELEEQMLQEKMKLKRFFENCSLDMSFEELRMQTCQDVEILGNGYWEVIREQSGDIAQFNYIPGFTMRLMPLDEFPTKVEAKVRVDDVTWGEITREKFFRRYIQLTEDTVVGAHLRTTFFKEFGDPRIVSAKSGKAFKDEAAWQKHLTVCEGKDWKATEVMHWRIHTSRSGYGIPRWIGNLLAVLGSRQVDEVNFLYFENKAVPPMVFLVSGGRVTEETINRLESVIEEKIKGKHNFHKILFIEAEGAASPMGENSGKAKIEMKPLTQAINSDALFQKYDERNIDKVGMSFRLPRMLRGDIRDFNRATAEAALRFAEKQVFAPLRNSFDWMINRRILPVLDMRFWTFCSNAPRLTDPMEQGELIAKLAEKGVLIPAEARQEAEKVLNRELRNLDAPWTQQPIMLTQAGIAPPVAPQEGEPAAETDNTERPPAESALTGTDVAVVITVNEAREDMGRGPLKLQDGSEDPDGFLTVSEFKAKRAKLGEVEGEAAAIKGDLGSGALASGGGLSGAAQGNGPGRKKITTIEMSEWMKDNALYLLAMRNAMSEAEVLEAQRDFDTGKAQDDDTAE